MSPIIIDKSTCTKCNVCAAVCTMRIISKSSSSGYPSIPDEKADHCIKCGHCESFCPQKALTLDFHREEKINMAPLDNKIDPKNMAFYLKSRRSIRHYTPKSVDKELIARLIDIARYAASGGNGQPVKWIVINEPSDVKCVARLTIDWMRSIQNTSHPLAPYVSGLIFAWDNGTDLICHNAPHLLIAHVPVDSFDDPAEAIIALTHVDIAAPAFGLGTCWAGFVKLALDSYLPLKDFLSIPQGRKAACPMLLGYPNYKVTSIPGRNPANITWR